MPATPTEVLHTLIEGVTGKKWDELPELYAEDTVVEHPMNTPRPTVIHGREGIRKHFASAAGLPFDMSAHNIVVHQTTDPEVVIGEYDYHVRPHAGGEFETRNIVVVTVRDGLIVNSRDYHDHLAMAAGLGGLDRLVAAREAS